MDLVKVPRGGRLGHKLPNALIKRAIEEEIRIGRKPAFVVH